LKVNIKDMYFLEIFSSYKITEKKYYAE